MLELDLIVLCKTLLNLLNGEWRSYKESVAYWPAGITFSQWINLISKNQKEFIVSNLWPKLMPWLSA